MIKKEYKLEDLIIYEDSDFLALNKPAGLLVHPLKKSFQKEPTLIELVLKKYPFIRKVGDDVVLRPGVVHRLDKETSGVLIVAKTQDFFLFFKKLLQNRQVEKTYLALVNGFLKEKKGVIDKAIGFKKGSLKRTVYKAKCEKEAITYYWVLNSYFLNNHYFSFLKLKPLTGRTHQLRVHLKSLHHPIVGDKVYGFRSNPFGLDRCFLHAYSLEFSKADNLRIKIEADLPWELKNIIDILENKS